MSNLVDACAGFGFVSLMTKWIDCDQCLFGRFVPSVKIFEKRSVEHQSSIRIVIKKSPSLHPFVNRKRRREGEGKDEGSLQKEKQMTRPVHRPSRKRCFVWTDLTRKDGDGCCIWSLRPICDIRCERFLSRDIQSMRLLSMRHRWNDLMIFNGVENRSFDYGTMMIQSKMLGELINLSDEWRVLDDRDRPSAHVDQYVAKQSSERRGKQRAFFSDFEANLNHQKVFGAIADRLDDQVEEKFIVLNVCARQRSLSLSDTDSRTFSKCILCWGNQWLTDTQLW